MQGVVLLAATVVCGYLVLLLYCDIRPPAAAGLSTAPELAGLRVTDVSPSGPAARAGIRPGDIILTVDGHAVRDRLDWLALDANIELGQRRIFRLDRSGARVTAPVDSNPATWSEWRAQRGPAVVIIRVVQFVILAIATLVAVKRPRDATAIVGAIFLAMMSVFSIAPPYRIASIWRTLPAPLGLLLWIPFLCSAALGGWWCSFSAVFPRQQLRGAPAWTAFWLPLVPGIGGQAVYAYFMLVRGTPAPPIPWWPASLVYGNILYLIAGVAILVANYRSLVDVNERRRIRVVTVGSLIGSLGGIPVAILFWQSRTPSVERSFLESPGTFAGTFLFLVLPLSFAYAILRHRLFDVRVIIRQGVRYAVARRALLALVPVGLAALAVDMLVHGDQPLASLLRSRLWIYGSVIAAVALLRAQRGIWLDALDRRFFRERYNAQQLLRQIADEVRLTDSLDRIASQVVAQVQKALHPRFVDVLIYESAISGYRSLARAAAIGAPPVDTLPALRHENKAVALVRLLGKPLQLSPAHLEWLGQQLPAADLEMLQAAGIDVLLPCGSGDASDPPLLALGEKLSEEPYADDDLDLLTAIACNIALRVPPVGRGAMSGAMPLDDPGVREAEPTVEECPQCGGCYDAGTGLCEHDGAALSMVRTRRLLGGRYRLDRRLGEGGMGTVYAAVDTSLDRTIAVKLIREDLIGAPAVAERFRHEARAAGSFAHPNVVTVHDFGLTTDNQAFLVMEMLEGVTLREALRRDHCLSAERAASVLEGVVSAVDAAHRQHLIHRDLKPENIFLVRRNGGELAKVLDFGIAKVVSRIGADAPLLASGPLSGTPMYMAPEQLRGEPPTEGWDIWALAVIAYEMLTGEHPFAGRGTVLLGGLAGAIGQPGVGACSHAGDLSETCAAFFARALSMDAAARPASAGQLLVEFEDALRVGRSPS